MKKKISALMCAIVFVLCFTSCSATLLQVGEIFEQLGDPSYEEPPLDEHTTDIEFQVPEYGKIHIKSYSVVDGYNGSKWLVLKFDYTNLLEEDDCCNSVVRYLNAYQDGVLLEPVSSVYDKDWGTMVKPGSSVEVITTMVLRNTTSDIDFEVKYDDEILATHTLSMVSL